MIFNTHDEIVTIAQYQVSEALYIKLSVNLWVVYSRVQPRTISSYVLI